jgi:membrane protease YdiL (CAAX protease family)
MFPMITGAVFAALFWLILFGTGLVNFWWGMTAAAGLLAAWSLVFSGADRRALFEFKKSYIFLGLLSAIVLYAVFWAGNFLSRLIFDFASGQIDSIYSIKARMDHWQIGLLLFFWIGPAEEIFWRGMIQRVLSGKYGPTLGWFVPAMIYAGVHLWAANFILFMAALICGLFWGWIYMRFGSLWPAIISHSVWDVAIFLVLPL